MLKRTASEVLLFNPALGLGPVVSRLLFLVLLPRAEFHSDPIFLGDIGI